MKRQRIRDAGWLHRWFFYHYETGKFAFILEGDPRKHEGYDGLDREYNHSGAVVKEHPIIIQDGKRFFGKFGKLTQNNQVVCNYACQHATQPHCECACGGKNHGISHLYKDTQDDNT